MNIYKLLCVYIYTAIIVNIATHHVTVYVHLQSRVIMRNHMQLSKNDLKLYSCMPPKFKTPLGIPAFVLHRNPAVVL